MQRIFEWRKINKYNSPRAEGLKRTLAAFTTLNRGVDETGGGHQRARTIQSTSGAKHWLEGNFRVRWLHDR